MQIKQSNIRCIEPPFTIVHIAYDKIENNGSICIAVQIIFSYIPFGHGVGDSWIYAHRGAFVYQCLLF